MALNCEPLGLQTCTFKPFFHASGAKSLGYLFCLGLGWTCGSIQYDDRGPQGNILGYKTGNPVCRAWQSSTRNCVCKDKFGGAQQAHPSLLSAPHCFSHEDHIGSITQQVNLYSAYANTMHACKAKFFGSHFDATYLVHAVATLYRLAGNALSIQGSNCVNFMRVSGPSSNNYRIDFVL